MEGLLTYGGEGELEGCWIVVEGVEGSEVGMMTPGGEQVGVTGMGELWRGGVGRRSSAVVGEGGEGGLEGCWDMVGRLAKGRRSTSPRPQLAGGGRWTSPTAGGVGDQTCGVRAAGPGERCRGGGGSWTRRWR